MIDIHRYLALVLQLIELPIPEDMGHIPGTVEAISKHPTIEPLIQLNLRTIDDLLVVIRTIGLDLGLIGDHEIPIGTIQNMIELELWTVKRLPSPPPEEIWIFHHWNSFPLYQLLKLMNLRSTMLFVPIATARSADLFAENIFGGQPIYELIKN